MVFKTTIVGSSPASSEVLKKLILCNSKITTLFIIFFRWFLSLLRIIKKDEDAADRSYFLWSLKWYVFSNDFLFDLLDIIFFKNLKRVYQRVVLRKKPVVSTKQIQLTNGFFYGFRNPFGTQSFTSLFLYGVSSVWQHLRLWVLPLTIALLFSYYSFVIKALPFSKLVFQYVLLINLFYLLISGFVFFIKRYQYRLYTSVIQRFWRRTLILFWVIEATTFITFFYLTLNANQEPVYMYDNIQLYKTHFYSWRYFLLKIIPNTIIIILTYFLLLSLKWNTFAKSSNVALIITILLLYITWAEFYQLFHLLNHYGTLYWVYDMDEHFWNLEIEFRRTRIVNHYATICLIAKFWHIVFAILFWIFFLLRGLEISRFRYPLLSANLQNFIIIYAMSWVYMYPWFKYSFRRFMDMPYYWFFFNNRKMAVFIFFNDMKLFLYGLVDFVITPFTNMSIFSSTPYYYWVSSSSRFMNSQFRKHNIRDVFITNFN